MEKGNSKGYHRNYDEMIIQEMEEENNRKMESNKRNAKKALYRAFNDYILCLENSLEYEEDLYNKLLIKIQIIKLKKEQKKYYKPSLLEMASYDLVRHFEHPTKKDALEKSSYSLVKKQKNKN